MNAKDYYNNKILYELGKIDYALARRDGAENSRGFAKIYSAMIAYGGKITFELLIKLTGLDRDTIVPKLKHLKDLGVISWDGEYLKNEKEIVAEKPDFRTWYAELQKKMKGQNIIVPEEEPSAGAHRESQESHDWVEIPYSEGVVLKVKKSKLKRLLE
jgi:hypothetical protein